MTATVSMEQTKYDIRNEFSFLGDWVARYEYIVDLGRKLPGLSESMRVDSHLVPGCQSRVWLHARREGALIHFDADSDAMIVRGLIALLLRLYSGRSAREIVSTAPDFFEALELGSHLSGSRANGLHAMIQRIHDFARALDDAPDSTAADPAGPH